jgi:hypothetical protein
MESTPTDMAERPIPNMKLKSPSINMFEVKGAINTPMVDKTEPAMYTNLCPNFSQKYPPRKLPITHPTVFREGTRLNSALVILNSSRKNGTKFPLELSKRAMMKYK